MFDSTNPNAIAEFDQVGATSTGVVDLNTSDSQMLSPKISSDMEGFKKIQLVSSTPFLTNSIKANASCVNTKIKEHGVENILFKARESGVKAPYNQVSTPRLQLTPLPSYRSNKRNDISSIFLEGSCSKSEGHCIKETNILSNSSPAISESCKSEVQKLLFFDSPLKINEHKLGYSADIQIRSAQNIFQSDTKSNDNPDITQSKITFKLPTAAGLQDLIPISKGGKNWRRTIVLPQRTSIDVNKRNTFQNIAMSRKSSIRIEQSRPSIRLGETNDNIPKIVELSKPQESELDDIHHTEQMNVSIVDHAESSRLFSPSNNVNINCSNQLNKSSSYILPLDRKNQSILLETTHDIVSKVLSKCSEKSIVPFHKLYDSKIINTMKKSLFIQVLTTVTVEFFNTQLHVFHSTSPVIFFIFSYKYEQVS